MTTPSTIPTHWVPPIGTLVKLKTFDMYASRRLTIWAWLRVEEIVDNRRVRVQVLNGDQPVHLEDGQLDNQREFPFDMIQAPLGWAPIYTVYLADRLNKGTMLNWLDANRGITVWANQELYSGPGGTGSLVFTPGDKEKPHWKYGFVETVHDVNRFKFVLVETADKKPDNAKKDGWAYNKTARVWEKETALS